MEFTLTRRVAEYSQIDPSDVEADEKNVSGGKGSSSSPLLAGEVGLFEFASRNPRPIPRKRERERSIGQARG